MPREISDEQFQYYEGRRQVADFVESIYNDPQLNREAKSLIKRKYPNLQIPDFDLENKIDQRFAQEDKRRQDAADDERRKGEDAKFKAARDKVREDYKFTDEAMTRLEKMMVDRNIGDYEVAASYMASKEPSSSEPADYDPGRWNHQKQEGFAEIAKDPEAWGRTEIMRAIFRDQQNAKGGV